MRKDTKRQENNLNFALIIMFIFSGSGIIQLFFFRFNPIADVDNKITKIQQYEMVGKTSTNVTAAAISSMNMQDLLTEVYIRDKSIETGIYTEEEAKNKLLKNSKFFENGKFSKRKFLAYLKHMSSILNININTHDYIKYLQLIASKEAMENITASILEECPIANIISRKIDCNKQKIIYGVKITPVIPFKDYKFSKQNIQNFVKEKKHEGLKAFVETEKRSGFIITIKLTNISPQIIDAVNYYLKHNSFDEIKLMKFLKQFAEDSQGFTKILSTEYKTSLEKSRLRGKNDKDILFLENHIQITSFSHVEKNEDNKLLFENNEYKKNFSLYGDGYCKVIVTEVIKRHDREITEEFTRDYILPTMEAFAHKDEEIEACHQMAIDHNSQLKPLHTTSGEKIFFDINSREYKALCYCHKGNAFVFEDAQGNPYIFLVTSIEGVPSNIGTINNLNGDVLNKIIQNKYHSFVKKEIFFSIFEICYNKLKKNLAQ